MSITIIVILLCIGNYIRLVQKQNSSPYDIALLDCGALEKPSYNIKKDSIVLLLLHLYIFQYYISY